MDEQKIGVKALRAPEAPTRDEVEDHEASGHSNYRSWCRACVAGRGRTDAHKTQESDEHALPTVAIDYGYLGDPGGGGEDGVHDGASPILVLRSGRDRWTSAEVYPSKGVQNVWCAKRLAAELGQVPWTRFTLKSDQEPAIMALKTAAARLVQAATGKEVVLEESPVSDSSANGLAENAVKEVKGVIRSLRWAFDELHGIKLDVQSPVLPWMVRHAGSMMSRARRGRDGRTAFELRKGRPYRRRLPAFGEKVMYLKAGKQKSRLEDRWLEGLFLGVQDRSDEVVVGTRDGVYKARTVRRLDPVQRRDAALAREMRGLPWEPIPGEPSEGGEIPAAMIRVVADPVVPAAELPRAMMVQEPVRRKLYVRRAEIEAYGETPGCQGCMDLILGTGRAVAHSADCRARIEAAMLASGGAEARQRVEDARRRVGTSAAVAVEPGLPPSPAASSGERPAGPEPAPKRARSVEGDSQVVSEAQVDQDMDAALMALGVCAVDVMEVFCPGRFTSRASAFDLRPGLALDLRTGWNLDRQADVECAWTAWRETKPALLVLSPMCKAFSVLQNLVKGSEKYEETKRQGLAHLVMSMQFAKAQVAAGRRFLFEHPWSAWSWKLPAVVEVMNLPGVQVVKGHQCCFGQKSVDPDGVERLVLKPTGWMTNAPHIAAALGRRCGNEWRPEAERHRHASLMSSRASATERYPPKLVTEVLKALRAELVQDGCLGALEVGPTVEEQDAVQAAAKGGEYKDVLDRVTGEVLDGRGVAKAREEEMQYMRSLKVFEYVAEEEAREITGRPPISVDWVDTNKGDRERPVLRSRLVVQETRRISTLGPEDAAAIFAATPPLEALRFVLSQAMTEQRDDRQMERVVAFLDISRAHLHSPIRREVFVKACREDHECPEGHCWRLLKAMYGLRDAGACFDKRVEEIMEELGYRVGRFSPCLYYNVKSMVVVFRHGDDFVVLGRRADVKEFAAQLGEKLIVKERGTLGPRKDLGDVSEIVVLNRIVRWCPAAGDQRERIEIEADARHVAVLAQQMGLVANSKPAVTPGIKDDGAYGEELDEARRAIFRSAAMRLAYLAQDRPEICFASKEIARCMQAPDEAAWTALKRAVRFCLGAPRIVWKFARQPPVSYVDVWSDSDHAGCRRTRRSTSCSVLMHGKHLLRVSSTTQTVIALSSGESEFYAAVKSISMALGAEEMGKDIGVTLKPRVKYDATAGAGIASRRGVGKVRHLHTPALWVQRFVQEGRVQLVKVAGDKNVADLGTKHVTKKVMWNLMCAMSVHAEGGRSALALRASGEV